MNPKTNGTLRIARLAGIGLTISVILIGALVWLVRIGDRAMANERKIEKQDAKIEKILQAVQRIETDVAVLVATRREP